MNKLLKNKKVTQIAILAAVLGLAATPAGRQYADKLQPLIEKLTGDLSAPEAPAAAPVAEEAK